MKKRVEKLDFEEVGPSRSGSKLNVWDVYIGIDQYLGIVKWFARAGRYAFWPTTEHALAFDDIRLQRIATFCALQTAKYYRKNK